MRRVKVKADHRADTRGSPWAGIPHCVIDSDAFRDLSLWARSVLLEIVRQMNGYNNGLIVLSQRQIAVRLNTTNFRKIGKAIAELMMHGFIDVAVEGQWKARMARQYRLTFVSSGKAGHIRPASNEYLRWTPEKKFCADTVSSRAAKTDDAGSAGEPVLADDDSAAPHRHRDGRRDLPADTSSSLISEPYQAPECGVASTLAKAA